MKSLLEPSPQADRIHCVCCALPARVLRHVAAKSGDPDAAGLLRAHEQASAHLRSHRRSKADQAAHRAGPPAHAWGHRCVHDAGGKMRLPGKLARDEGDAASADPTVNHAYANLGITLEFYAKVFKRKSLDGHGVPVVSSVHYGERFANAMWSGKEMLFGDGDGVHVLGFAQSLDIVAHELTHAVTQHRIAGGLGEQRTGRKVNLVGEAGALNESLSDVFASMVKQWHLKQDVHEANWLVGEGILAPHIGKAVRSLKFPGDTTHTYDDDDQPRDMAGFVRGGDAHTNSGIPNRAFYLAASGIGGRSWEKAGPIWYEAVERLTRESTFRDAADATAATAAQLFGDRSAEHKAVIAAWKKVKVLP
ncbi:MAG TPA: M4 family metallopeptidase [Ramlibacter sp.]|nr:M4 family metallopeptidase [Ramlibacter sp.]